MNSLPVFLFILSLASPASQGCVHGAASPASAAPPAGWWVIETAQAPDEPGAWTLVHDLGVPGAAWRFEADELDSVRPGYLVDRVALVMRAEGANAWHLGEAGDDEHSCSLQRAGAGLALRCVASDARLTFRIALPEETQSAEHALAQHGSAQAACAHASACATVAVQAFPYLEEYVPQGPADLRICERATLTFVRQFRATRLPVPPACGR